MKGPLSLLLLPILSLLFVLGCGQRSPITTAEPEIDSGLPTILPAPKVDSSAPIAPPSMYDLAILANGDEKGSYSINRSSPFDAKSLEQIMSRVTREETITVIVPEGCDPELVKVVVALQEKYGLARVQYYRPSEEEPRQEMLESLIEEIEPDR